jgi:NAD+ synthetase
VNFFTEEQIIVLHEELVAALKGVRKERNFNAAIVVNKKARIINKYMATYGLKTCVVAISGGIDSAVTYALINEAKKFPGSPIERIVPIFLPVYKSDGATNQESAKAKADELLRTFSGEAVIEIDITPVHHLLKETVDKAMGVTGDAWASGQLVSYTRTPTYYYVTSLMNNLKSPSIVCGTTNRDEGAYLGYFGKASDGMVDIQMISDLHKSEVYQIATYLGVPQSVIDAVPTGDMYDNRSDVEVFGSPYDFVEFYLNYLGWNHTRKHDFHQSLTNEAGTQFLILKGNLDDLHSYNKHKYLAASPAVHMDVIKGKIKGGWQYNVYKGEA